MDELKKMVEKAPELQSDRSQYLKIKEAGGPVRVVLVGCKNATNKEYETGKEVQGAELLFEQNGVPKKYFVPTLGKDGKFHYLIERFAEIEEGTELDLEFKRKKGSVQGYIEVREAQEVVKGQKVEEEEIPMVEDDEASSENLGTGHAPKMED